MKDRDYREKTVKGMVATGLIPKFCDVTVRMTSDKRGQSLSLQAYNLLIEIPLESVKGIIKVTEKGAKA